MGNSRIGVSMKLSGNVDDLTGVPTVTEVKCGGKKYAVRGKCLRCGKCCEAIKCPHLAWEYQNDVRVAVCKVYWTRPWGCALFPRDPQEELQEGCGFYWEEVK